MSEACGAMFLGLLNALLSIWSDLNSTTPTSYRKKGFVDGSCGFIFPPDEFLLKIKCCKFLTETVGVM